MPAAAPATRRRPDGPNDDPRHRPPALQGRIGIAALWALELKEAKSREWIPQTHGRGAASMSDLPCSIPAFSAWSQGDGERAFHALQEVFDDLDWAEPEIRLQQNR